MAKETDYISAVPAHATKEFGPRYAATGCPILGGLVFLTMIAIVLSIGVVVDMKNGGWPLVLTWGTVTGVCVLGWVLAFRTQRVTGASAGTDVLRDVLKFEIDNNLYGVAATMFFRPDTVAAGTPTSLLLFLQNHSSRSRFVEIKIRKNSALGALSGRKVKLRVGPGQAALYRHTFEVPSATKGGQLFVSCPIRIRLLRGEGVKIIGPKTWKERLALIRIRFIGAGLNVLPASSVDDSKTTTLNPLQFISLYTPDQQEPNWSLLEQLSQASPEQELLLNTPLET